MIAGSVSEWQHARDQLLEGTKTACVWIVHRSLLCEDHESHCPLWLTQEQNELGRGWITVASIHVPWRCDLPWGWPV